MEKLFFLWYYISILFRQQNRKQEQLLGFLRAFIQVSDCSHKHHVCTKSISSTNMYLLKHATCSTNIGWQPWQPLTTFLSNLDEEKCYACKIFRFPSACLWTSLWKEQKERISFWLKNRVSSWQSQSGLYSSYPFKNYFSSTMAMGIPHRSAIGIHNDHGNFDGWLHPLSVSFTSTDYLPSFLHPTGIEYFKIWYMLHSQPRFSQPDSAMRNPYQDFSKTTPNAVVNAIVDDSARNPMTHPRHNDCYPIIATFRTHWFWQPIGTHCNHCSNWADATTRLNHSTSTGWTTPSFNTTTMATPSSALCLLNAQQYLEDFLQEYPQPVDCLDNNNHTPPSDTQQLSSSVTTMFALQMRVLHTINVLLGELIDLVELLLDAHTCSQQCPLPSCPLPTLTVPGPILISTHMQSPQWHHNSIHLKTSSPLGSPACQPIQSQSL